MATLLHHCTIVLVLNVDDPLPKSTRRGGSGGLDDIGIAS